YQALVMIGALEKDKVQSGDVSAIDKRNWMAPEVLRDEASNEKLSHWEGFTKAENDVIVVHDEALGLAKSLHNNLEHA
nr:hypothetical protein [Tanacetum cinerariifolium]